MPYFAFYWHSSLIYVRLIAGEWTLLLFRPFIVCFSLFAFCYLCDNVQIEYGGDRNVCDETTADRSTYFDLWRICNCIVKVSLWPNAINSSATAIAFCWHIHAWLRLHYRTNIDTSINKIDICFKSHLLASAGIDSISTFSPFNRSNIYSGILLWKTL